MANTQLKEKSVTVLFPGGFKPPHKGHLHLILNALKNKYVKKVVIIIGLKHREGIDAEDSGMLFGEFFKNTKLATRVQIYVARQSESPVGAAYEYIHSSGNKGDIFTLLASDKDLESDLQRIEDFVSSHTNNGKYKAVADEKGFSVISPQDIQLSVQALAGIDSTKLRDSIRKGEFTFFQNYIPPYVDKNSAQVIFNQMHAKVVAFDKKKNIKSEYINTLQEIIKEQGADTQGLSSDLMRKQREVDKQEEKTLEKRKEYSKELEKRYDDARKNLQK